MLAQATLRGTTGVRREGTDAIAAESPGAGHLAENPNDPAGADVACRVFRKRPRTQLRASGWDAMRCARDRAVSGPELPSR
jgi:hypothetical protein